jgi:hypothetical protein
LPAAERNILENFVDENKSTLELPRTEKRRKDKNKVKENLQMEKIWIKTEDWHTPPLLKRKRTQQPTTILGDQRPKEEVRKSNRENCASLRQTPLERRREISLGLGSVPDALY